MFLIIIATIIIFSLILDLDWIVVDLIVQVQVQLTILLSSLIECPDIDLLTSPQSLELSHKIGFNVKLSYV